MNQENFSSLSGRNFDLEILSNMWYKVIFDTNFCRNTWEKDFFWNRKELLKFSNLAEVIIPNIVIEEIKKQKIKLLDENKKNFYQNQFFKILGIDKNLIENFNSQNYVDNLLSNETIKYTLINLSLNKDIILDKISELSLNNLEPFESTNDKWFKDCLIYFTILEYAESNSKEKIFVLTKDWRFKEALSKHENISLIESFEDFRKYSTSYYQEEYFLWVLSENFWTEINSKDIIDIEINISDNILLTINIDWELKVIQIDNREIIQVDTYHSKNNSYLKSDIEKVVESFCTSDSWQLTHNICKDIIKNWYLDYFSQDDIIKIFDSVATNDQIYKTIWYTVRETLEILYKKRWYLISSENKEFLDTLIEFWYRE